MFSLMNSHHNIWKDAEVPQKTYHYYHPETKGLDFSALMDDVKVSKEHLLQLASFLLLLVNILILLSLFP